MNKYKSIYTEELLNAEREQIKKIVADGEMDFAEKVSTVKAIMAFTDSLVNDEEVSE